jgi:mannan endo-1,4-beta-mannosidase
VGKRALALFAVALVVPLSSCAIGTPGPATDITNVGATLNGNVYSSLEGNTTWWFDYGDTPDYGSATADATVAIADDDPHPVSAPIYGLLPGTTYHFRMCVKDAQEEPPRTICSKDNTFTTLADSPFVTAEGTELRLDGDPYRFTGMNVYNANSRGECWYALASGSGLDDALAAMGPGVDAIRAWFFESLATTGGERDWSGFDHTLAVARAHGVKVIPTLTNQWADCDPAGYKTGAWYEGGYNDSYRDWVTEVVSRYRNDPNILAWQLVNEAEVKPSADATSCSPGAADILTDFAADIGGWVKALDPEHLVSLGTIGGGQCGAANEDYEQVHAVDAIGLCEYHDYNAPTVPMPGDQWNGLQVRLDQCAELGKPLIVGETGIRPNDVGGTFEDRADAFRAKLDAQFEAGVAGELVWAWSSLGSTLGDYDVGPDDPVLDALAEY